MSLILLTAPRFIAERIATVLGAASTKRGEFDSLAECLSCNVFAILVTIAISALIGIVDLSENWQAFTEKFSSVSFTVKLLGITLFFAVTVGASWALIGNKFVMKILNAINVKTGGNKRNLDGNLLNRIFADGKEHFIIVRIDDKDVAVVFICSAPTKIRKLQLPNIRRNGLLSDCFLSVAARRTFPTVPVRRFV